MKTRSIGRNGMKSARRALDHLIVHFLNRLHRFFIRSLRAHGFPRALHCANLLARSLTRSPSHGEKIYVYWYRASISYSFNTYFFLFLAVQLRFEWSTPNHISLFLSALVKARSRYENYPLKCIREGRFKTFPEIENVMKLLGIKVTPRFSFFNQTFWMSEFHFWRDHSLIHSLIH